MNAQACGYLAYSDTSAADCETRCNAADACAGFVQVNDVPCCFLKSKLVNQNANSRTVTHLKSSELLVGGSDHEFLRACLLA